MPQQQWGGVKAASTTVDVPTVVSSGTTTPQSGTAYYLYDITHGACMDTWAMLQPTAAKHGYLTVTPDAVGAINNDTYYTFHTSQNASGYMKSGNANGPQNVWWDGSNTAATAQWYLTASSQGCKIDIGETDKATTAGSQTRSTTESEKKLYLFLNTTTNYLDFTNVSTNADEFIFITPDDYNKLDAKIMLANAINAAAAQRLDTDAAVSVFNDASSTADNYTAAYTTLLQTENFDITELVLNTTIKSGTGWESYNTSSITSNDNKLTVNPTGTDVWVYQNNLSLPAGYYEFSVETKNCSSGLSYYNAAANSDIKSNFVNGKSTQKFYLASAISNLTLGMHTTQGESFDITKFSIKYLNATPTPDVTINDATTSLSDNATSKNIQVSRSISQTKWNTLCLPFDLTGGEMTLVFGSGYQAYKLTDVTENGVVDYMLNFTKTYEIKAGTPILVKRSENADWRGESYIFTDKTISTDCTSTTYNDITFTGVYKKTTLAADDYFINNNTIYRAANSGSYVYPTRAYFKNDKASSVRSIALNLDGEMIATSIEALNSGVIEQQGAVYNLNGQQVSGKPQPGIYIKNGKKVVIK